MHEFPVSSRPLAETLYLDLLKQVLTRTGLEETYRPLHSRSSRVRRVVNPLLLRTLQTFGLELRKRIDPDLRREGYDWPSDAETMIGMVRLTNVERCVLDVLDAGVPGDFLEAGVWRGGATILMRAILKVREVTDRVIWAADSFQGLPKPDATRYPADEADEHWSHDLLAVGLEEVKSNFAKYRLLDEQVKFLPGWFRDTLPEAPVERLAILRVDGDMYESTMVALEALYPRLSPGGYAIIDDYVTLDGCRRAVTDYRTRNGIADEIQPVDHSAVFWKKSEPSHVGSGAYPEEPSDGG